MLYALSPLFWGPCAKGVVHSCFSFQVSFLRGHVLHSIVRNGTCRDGAGTRGAVCAICSRSCAEMNIHAHPVSSTTAFVEHVPLWARAGSSCGARTQEQPAARSPQPARSQCQQSARVVLISVAVPRFGSSRQGKIASKARNFKRVHSLPKRPSIARPTPDTLVRDHSGRELPCWAAR